MHERFCGEVSSFLVAAHVYAITLDHRNLITFPTRHGVTRGIFVESPSPNPPWVIVLFGGTPGDIHLDVKGATTLRGNVMIRSAHHWIEQDDAVALVDTTSDKPEGVDDSFRFSKQSFTDTKAVVAALRQRFPGSKIALVSTNAGTISVGNALERDPTLADAFVLTSPVTVSHRGSPSLADLDMDGAKYRVLVVSNRHDSCPSRTPRHCGRPVSQAARYRRLGHGAARRRKGEPVCGDAGRSILSAYEVACMRVWIITEADRRATTLLFPQEC
ncbi:hypothetical protein [Paraburkholderia aspalathi]|uniref:hypothetical protein n=1 Tax=Paraburkholderia aspalathi TaxID=1324617 RepID=UPI001B2F1470|nr:hypothetical protein [Paraburkholderia aspalathi]CAE6837288.1 hypothetical protein R20943_06932 [Paraburkholderia aspalathi]